MRLWSIVFCTGPSAGSNPALANRLVIYSPCVPTVLPSIFTPICHPNPSLIMPPKLAGPIELHKRQLGFTPGASEAYTGWRRAIKSRSILNGYLNVNQIEALGQWDLFASCIFHDPTFPRAHGRLPQGPGPLTVTAEDRLSYIHIIKDVIKVSNFPLLGSPS